MFKRIVFLISYKLQKITIYFFVIYLFNNFNQIEFSSLCVNYKKQLFL